ncbi:MAG: signal peptide peptidase SppA [bacterium]
MARGRDWFLGFLLLAALGIFIFFVVSIFWSAPEDGFELAAGRHIGLVKVEGVILESEGIVKEIERFGNDDHAAALIVRIDSPGGGVAASQEIYEAVKKVRNDGKFVIASMASVAASGGYYVACGADTIMANPGTTTGSIGVIAEMINTTELLNKIGVKFEVIKSGKYKDSGSPWRPMTEDDRRYFQSYVDDAYDQFVEIVAKERGLDKSEIMKFADGRVFTGQQALANRLIDVLGTYQDAVMLAAQAVGLEGKPRVVTPRKRRITMFDLLFGDLEQYWIRLHTLPVLRYQMVW